MLKSKVGYSIDADSFNAGKETATKAAENMTNAKLGFLYTSVKNDIKEVVKGIKSVTNTPIIGCTSSGAIMVPDGIIASDNGFAGMMMLDDSEMTIGVACHEAGKDARAIGRKVAIEAVENAKTTRAPAYFYMVASPKEEEDYLMGIQDVIGRVPMFGGSAADDTVEGKWKIICNDKVFTDGVAVAFFYTDNEIVTTFTGAYRETNNVGIITEVKDNRTLVSIDGVSALKKYANWTNVNPASLKGQNLLAASITKPLGVKDPLGNLTVIRHPMFGNDMGTRTIADDTITLGNKAVEGTAIIQLEATVDELIDSTGATLKDVRRQLYSEPAAYFLVHCGGRKLGIGDRIEEVHKQLVKESKGVPFITVFTFGEYGYDEHSANICGGLMLSFTAFAKKLGGKMKNLVNGKELDSSNNQIIEIINPATKQIIATVPNSTEEDVDYAVKSAEKAQKAWAELSIYKRGEILEKFVSLVERDKETLAITLCKETGKPIKEARAEIANTKTFVYAYVERAKHLYGINIPTGNEPGQENTIQFTIRQPLGVVACIIPFNFPCDLFGQKVPSALIMGNAVIVKPSTYNPLTLHKYCLLLKEAGVPDGVINCISGDGPIVGQALARHKGVHLVSVTGSTAVGKQTMETASKNLTHVMLELGGNDAFILDKDGDIDLAVEEMVWGRLYNTGQVCCASKRFLVHNDRKEEFTEKAISRISKMRVGNPLEESSEIGCLINEKAATRVEEQVKLTISQGAKIAFGGRRNGAFFEPTVLVNVTKDMDVMKDMEIFGPVIPICGFDSIDEAIEIANSSSFGLCGNIITNNINNAFKVANKLEVGGAVINGASFFRSAEMPFGGWKQSGIGNEGISTTLQEMSRIKTIVLKNVLK